MKEFNTISRLISALKMKDYTSEDFDDIAIGLMRNFSIRKVEADSFGTRHVRYEIVELEFYLYNKENNDWPTYNRDCVAGQWFFHRSGVDIAFQTHLEGNELVQFGGILIRGLKKYVDDTFIGYIGGAQRCCFELFNNSKEYPELCETTMESEFSIYKSKRVRIGLDENTGTQFRYFRPIPTAQWETPRVHIFEKKKNGEVLVMKASKAQKYPDAVTSDENGFVQGTLVYPR